MRGSSLAAYRLLRSVDPIQAAVDAQSLEPTRIRVQYLKLKWAGSRHELPAHRHAARAGHHVPGQCVDLLRNVSDLEFGADNRGHLIQVGTSIGKKGFRRLV